MSSDGERTAPPTQGELFSSEGDEERTAPLDLSAPPPDVPDAEGAEGSSHAEGSSDAEGSAVQTTAEIGALPPPVPGHAGSPPSPIETGEEPGRPPATPDLGSAPPPLPAQPSVPPAAPAARRGSKPSTSAKSSTPSKPARDVAAEQGLDPIEAQPMQLLRVSPRSRAGERIDLDPLRTSYAVGRAESNEVRLYTASASRKHARIYLGASGYWVIEPVGERSVAIDDDPSREPVPLEENMNLVMGQDHLRFVKPSRGSVDRNEVAAASGPSAPRRGVIVWVIGGVGVLAALVAAWLLL